jgi:hypothetical protein
MRPLSVSARIYHRMQLVPSGAIVPLGIDTRAYRWRTCLGAERMLWKLIHSRGKITIGIYRYI